MGAAYLVARAGNETLWKSLTHAALCACLDVCVVEMPLHGAQVLLRWNLQYGSGVIPKSTNQDHIKSNADIWGWQLDKQDYDRLATVKTQVLLPSLNTHISGSSSIVHAQLLQKKSDRPLTRPFDLEDFMLYIASAVSVERPSKPLQHNWPFEMTI